VGLRFLTSSLNLAVIHAFGGLVAILFGDVLEDSGLIENLIGAV